MSDKVINELVKGLTIHYDHAKEWKDEILRAVGRLEEGSDLNYYQEEARKFAVYKDEIYPVLALNEEAGEVAALYAKAIRKNGNAADIDPDTMMDELGDVLWNLAAIASEFDFALAEVAEHNLRKLRARKDKDEIVERKKDSK